MINKYPSTEQKIKVGFYLRNEGYPDADLRVPEKGNPGVGGTQFTTVATAYYLNKLYSDQLDILLLANSTKLLPPDLNVCCADNLVDAAIKSEEKRCDIFIFKSPKSYSNNAIIYDQLRKLQLKAIARSNNTPDVPALNQIADCPQIKAHVCVGHEQLDLLRDHKIFAKSTLIFNPFNVDNFIPKNHINKRGNTVVFLGNIIPVKGFHYLARVWRQILQKRPDAKLIVIGSGQLYDHNKVLGKWGVAEETYEAQWIRPFLSDENGNLLDSVDFVGLLGEEKIEILQQADVGVVNPSGRTEVCPGSALEIQASGTAVVSGARQGLLDTVIHGKTGLLGNNDQELIKNILYFLNNPSVAQQFGKNGIQFIKEKFDPCENARQWLELFIDICNEKAPRQKPMKNNHFYRAKLVREGMRRIKKYVPLLKWVPALIEIKGSMYRT
jgi:glycosyltransferase involved in cell wall biosynthesis